MILSVFLQGIVITILFSGSFALGGYFSFRILSSQRKKETDLSSEDMFTNDQLKIKLVQSSVLLEKVKNNNFKLSVLCNEILTKMLSETVNNPDLGGMDFLKLVCQAIENYTIEEEKIL